MTDMKCIYYNNLSFSPFNDSGSASTSQTRRSKRLSRVRFDEADEDAENERARREQTISKEEQEQRDLENILKELSKSNNLVDNSLLENVKMIFVVGGPGSGRVIILLIKSTIKLKIFIKLNRVHNVQILYRDMVIHIFQHVIFYALKLNQVLNVVPKLAKYCQMVF